LEPVSAGRGRHSPAWHCSGGILGSTLWKLIMQYCILVERVLKAGVQMLRRPST